MLGSLSPNSAELNLGESLLGSEHLSRIAF